MSACFAAEVHPPPISVATSIALNRTLTSAAARADAETGAFAIGVPIKLDDDLRPLVYARLDGTPYELTSNGRVLRKPAWRPAPPPEAVTSEIAAATTDAAATDAEWCVAVPTADYRLLRIRAWLEHTYGAVGATEKGDVTVYYPLRA